MLFRNMENFIHFRSLSENAQHKGIYRNSTRKNLAANGGGDGKSTFALPNLQGSAPMHPGQGPGLSLYDLGQQGGSETVTLLESEIPAHTHQTRAVGAFANQLSPANNTWGRSTANPYTSAQTGQMAPLALATTGNNAPHNNMQPYLTLYFCIALQGVFPPRP